MVLVCCTIIYCQKRNSGNDQHGPTKRKAFPDWQSNYQLLKKGPVIRSHIQKRQLLKLHTSAIGLSLYSSNVSNITRRWICWTYRMEIKCVLCCSIPHVGSVCTHITIHTTWLIDTGWGAKSIMGIRKLQLSSKEKKIFLGTGEALTHLPPMLCLYT